MDISDLPPGVEDYVDEFVNIDTKEKKNDKVYRNNILGIAKTKAEKEIEEHLLGLKLRLLDGSVGRILHREDRDVAGQFVYLCIPCGATCTGEGCLQLHIQGKKHKSKMATCPSWPPTIYDEHPFYKKMKETQQGVKLNAFKNERKHDESKHSSDSDDFVDSDGIIVGAISRIQNELDNYTMGPLVGLEYLVELRPNEDITHLNYYCTLCDKQGNDTTIINHLVSFLHRSKFIDVHFPKASLSLLEYRNQRSLRSGVGLCVEKLTAAAQALGGMRRVWVARADVTKLTSAVKEGLCRRTRNAPHVREHPDLPDTDLSHLVDHDLIRRIGNDQEKFYYEKEKQLLAEIRNKPQSRRSPSPPRVQAPRRGSPRRRRSPSMSSISSRDVSPPRSGAKDHRNHGGSSRYEHRHVDWLRGKVTARVNRLEPVRDQNLPQGDLRFLISDLGTKSREDSRDRDLHRSRERSPRGERHRRNGNEDKIHSKSLKRNSNIEHKLELYRKELESFINMLETQLSYHEKNPEKHPLYPDEWKKFWSRRYKELQAEGKDASKHDFKSEWVVYWTNRMKELFDDSIRDKKAVISRRLKIDIPRSPSRHRSPSPQHNLQSRRILESRIDSPMITRNRSRSPIDRRSLSPIDHRSRSPVQRRSSSITVRAPSVSHGRNASPPKGVVDVSDTEMKIEPEKDESLSSWDERSLRSISPDFQQLDQGRRNNEKKKMERVRLYRKEEERYGFGGPPPVDDDPVSLLRLLSALENYLGSLGPKVVDLLTEALKMEKSKPNSSEKLFQDEDYSILLDTVKEKLKGQLQAGLVDKTAVGAARSAVTRSAAMLHASRLAPKPRTSSPVLIRATSDKLANLASGIDAKDKAAVASQIASALVARGKKNVTPQELAMLVEAVMGAAKASKAKTSSAASIITAAPIVKEAEPAASALQLLRSAYDDNAKAPVQNVEMKKADLDLNKEKEGSPDAMDGLSDSDLQTLLQNFKDLSSDEQRGLIAYLKKLEAKEPKRVEKLRKFVSPDSLNDDKTDKGRAISPLALRGLTGSNPIPGNKSPPFDDSTPKTEIKTVKVDSDDDDDYNFDEVFKSAEKQVNENQLKESETVKAGPSKETTVTQQGNAAALLASLLGTLQKPAATISQANISSAPSSEDSASAILRLVQSAAGQNLLSALSINNVTSQIQMQNQQLSAFTQALPIQGVDVSNTLQQHQQLQQQQQLLAQQLALSGQHMGMQHLAGQQPGMQLMNNQQVGIHMMHNQQSNMHMMNLPPPNMHNQGMQGNSQMYLKRRDNVYEEKQSEYPQEQSGYYGGKGMEDDYDQGDYNNYDGYNYPPQEDYTQDSYDNESYAADFNHGPNRGGMTRGAARGRGASLQGPRGGKRGRSSGARGNAKRGRGFNR